MEIVDEILKGKCVGLRYFIFILKGRKNGGRQFNKWDCTSLLFSAVQQKLFENLKEGNFTLGLLTFLVQKYLIINVTYG